MTTDQTKSAQSVQETLSEDLRLPPDAIRQPLPTLTASPEGQLEKEQSATPQSTGTKPDVVSKTVFADSAHQYIRGYIRLADQKATFFFGGATALLAFLYKNQVSSRWIKPVMTWNILDIVAFVAMIALAIGALISLFVVIPRTHGSRRGFLFWEAIAEYENGRQYADDLWLLSPATLFQIKAEQCFDLAKVCRTKYRILKYALWCSAVGLLASFIVFLTL